MSKVYEVMTQALATCTPETSVAHAAAIMQERDIGNVLVVEEGQLRGIVTDRDLALQALIAKDDPRQIPVSKFMTPQVITGEATWSLEQAAQVMAKHQIRRLPIVQNGEVVGIVSLGDIARSTDQKDVIAKSLQAISRPASIAARSRSGRGSSLISFTLGAFATAAMTWLAWNRAGRAFRKQIVKSDLYHAARRSVDGVASSKALRDTKSKLTNLTAQLPALEYLPARPKHSLFG